MSTELRADESFLPAKSPASLTLLFRCTPPTYFSLLPRELWLFITRMLTEGLIENTKQVESDWTYGDVRRQDLVP